MNNKSLYLISIPLMSIVSILSVFNAGFDSSSLYWLLGLSGASAFAFLFFERKNFFNTGKPFIILFLFWFFCFLSMIWSVNTIRTFVEFIQITLFVLVFAVAGNAGKEKFEKAIKTIFITTAAISFFGIAEFLFSERSRIHSTFYNPNPFGIFLAMVFIISWGYYLKSGKKKNVFFSSVFLITLLLSGSRASIIALLISLPFLFVVYNKKSLLNKFFKTVGVFAFSFGITQGLIILKSIIRNALTTDFDLVDRLVRTSTIASSSGGRIEYWRVAGDLISNRPLLGYGLGSFSSGYYLEYNMNSWFSRFAHNHYLQMIAEIGIIGFGIFVVFLVYTFLIPFLKKVIKRENDSKIIYLTACLAFLLHIAVDFSWNFPAVTALFFLLLGYSCGFNENNKLKYGAKTLVASLSIISVLFSGWIIASEKIISRSIETYPADSEKAISMIENHNRFNLFNGYPEVLHGRWMLSKYIDTNDDVYLEKAYSSVKTGINRNNFNSEYHIILGRIYELKSDLDSAEESYYFAKETAAYDPSPYLELGNFYRRSEKIDEAIYTYESFMSIKSFALRNARSISDNQSVVNILLMHLHLVNLYESLENYEKSEYHMNEVVDLVNTFEFLQKYFEND